MTHCVINVRHDCVIIVRRDGNFPNIPWKLVQNVLYSPSWRTILYVMTHHAYEGNYMVRHDAQYDRHDALCNYRVNSDGFPRVSTGRAGRVTQWRVSTGAGLHGSSVIPLVETRPWTRTRWPAGFRPVCQTGGSGGSKSRAGRVGRDPYGFCHNTITDHYMSW